MLCRRAAHRAEDRAEGYRHGRLSARHVAEFRSLVTDLVECAVKEACEFDLANRPRSRHRRADRCADEAGLRDWRVAHPLRAEFVDQPLGRAEGAEYDILAH